MYDTQVRIDSLFIYPVKACRGVRVDRLRFTETGTIEADREWVIADTNGDVVWQGSHPRLALVQPAITENALVLGAPDRLPISVSRTLAENPCRVRVWNDIAKTPETYEGFDAGPRAAALLRATTNADLRLIRLASGGLRHDSINPVHVCSSSSLHELNQALVARGHEVVDIVRFRPNIVLASAVSPLLPFIEEQFSALQWIDGGKKSSVAIGSKCIRCVVPNVDLATAEVGNEPADTVAELSAQRYPGQPSCFGIYGKATPNSSLRTGTIIDAKLNF